MNNLRGEKFVCLKFQRFQFIMEGMVGQNRSHHSFQEAESIRKGPGEDLVPKDTLRDLFHPTRSHLPESHHFPIVYSKFEPINGLNHSVGLSPSDHRWELRHTQRCALISSSAFLQANQD
jgi:hypothetical protein